MLIRTLTLAAVLAATSAHAAEPDFSPERFRAHVTFLADDLLEGRKTGTRGHEIAARYIASQFALMGLKPGGENGGWYQSVGLAEVSLTGDKPTVTITGGKGGAQRLEHGGQVTVRGPTAGAEADLSAPLVFAGYGVTDKALGVDDYKGLDVRGKVVVVLNGVPKGMDSEIAAHLTSEQNRFAAEHGAVGIVRVPTLSAAKVFPWATALQYANDPAITWVAKDGAPFDYLHGLKARVSFSQDAAPVLFEGAARTYTQVLAEADRGQRPKGFALKTRADIKAATKVRHFSSPEVIALIEGSDPKLKDEYVVLMGHADHLGVKPDAEGDGIYNGALDNAAGVATLLEVAHGFVTSGQRPRRSVLVIANTGEEEGLLGAEFFAHHPTVPADKIVAGVDLDMPLITYDFTDVVAYGAAHSTLDKVFEKAGASMGVKLSPDPTPDEANFVRSDHYALVKAGAPAVMLATGMANGGQAAWDKFLKDHYHKPSDDLSQPIVWSAGAKFARFNYLVARDLADADEAPRWYAKDYFGDTFAPKAAKAAKAAP